MIPLTRIGHAPVFTTESLLSSLPVHLFLVGLPAALVAQRAAGGRLR